MLLEKDLPRVLESSVYIRFQDCDPFGHLNNARYADYFMDARFEQMVETYQFNLFAVGKEMGKNWVVSKAKTAYLRPAQFMETVRIRTRLIHFSSRQIVVEGMMLDRAGKQLKAVSWIEFTFVDLASGRPTAHTDEQMSLYAAIHEPHIYDAVPFDDRVGQLKTAVRRQTERSEKQQLL